MIGISLVWRDSFYLRNSIQQGAQALLIGGGQPRGGLFSTQLPASFCTVIHLEVSLPHLKCPGICTSRDL